MRDNMDNLKNANPVENAQPARLESVPGRALKQNVDKKTDEIKEKFGDGGSSSDNGGNSELSLNDDRRVKVLSPGTLVAKRFFRNRLAVVGLSVLIAMFLFSFLGGLISPYKEDQIFYRNDMQRKDYAGVIANEEYRYTALDSETFTGVIQAQALLAAQKNSTEFTFRDITYGLTMEGENFFSVSLDGNMIGFAYKDIVNLTDTSAVLSDAFVFEALKSFTNGGTSFTVDGVDYAIDEDGSILKDGALYGTVGQYIVQAKMPDIVLTHEFKEGVIEAIENGEEEFVYTDADGVQAEYTLTYDAGKKLYNVKQEVSTRVIDAYSAPSKAHWCGTDRNGMDMLTRLMYGGRVSLMIGFIVIAIQTVIGVILGGIAGFFGKWIDNIIMRIVDIFYCIPSMPIIIILGAMMDDQNVEPQIRMLYLMLILGFLGWAGIARLVRGQILSLREQEFMTATEACGVRISRRIFKHLVPNVMPQLIVNCTMGLGSVILTEATLSFLGLGVRFPFASWGNIINDVNDTFVLTEYLFIWIPAGVCLLLTILAFNLVGDGLRDAFDPKMKR